MKQKLVTGLLALSVIAVGCSETAGVEKKEEINMELMTKPGLPEAKDFVSSPLRNSIRLELDAPTTEVWKLVGDPSRMPEYSEGLLRVNVMRDTKERCTGFTCLFKPAEPGDEPVQHRAIIKWFEPETGYASVDEEPNPFGLTQSLSLLTLESMDKKTILNWQMHFHAGDVEANKSSLDQALNQDIAKRLIRRFGGRVLESFVEGSN